jgi:hypothetical protein
MLSEFEGRVARLSHAETHVGVMRKGAEGLNIRATPWEWGEETQSRTSLSSAAHQPVGQAPTPPHKRGSEIRDCVAALITVYVCGFICGPRATGVLVSITKS